MPPTHTLPESVATGTRAETADVIELLTAAPPTNNAGVFRRAHYFHEPEREALHVKPQTFCNEWNGLVTLAQSLQRLFSFPIAHS